MDMGRLLTMVLGIMAMVAMPTHAQQGTGTVVYDPFSLLFLLLVSAVVIGLAVYFFVVLRDSSNQTAVTNAQVTALNSQTNNMNNLVQAMVTSLNVNTAIAERMAQHEMEMENKYYRLLEAQILNDIYFKNTLLELYAMQLTSQDIRQLMSDKLRVSALQSFKPSDIDITVKENPQGTTSTR
jgi:type II secretory pathway component PulK